MSAPKSVTKVDKTGKVTYISNIDAANYYIFELSRAAMRDVGKFISKKFKISYYQHFKRRTGNAGKATKYSVISGKNTKYPRVQIGLKTGKVDGFYAYFQEFGSRRQPRLALLSHAAHDNISEIIRIESQYLSGLSGEADRLAGIIDESDYEGDADD